MDYKECNKCNLVKKLENFPKQKTGKLGRRATCNKCMSLWSKTYRKTNKNTLKNSWKIHQSVYNGTTKSKKRKEKFKNKNKDYWYDKDVTEIFKICTECKESKSCQDFFKSPMGRYGRDSKCKVCIQEKKKLYNRNNPETKFLYNCRGIIKRALLTTYSDTSSLFKILGLTQKELILYFEKLFIEDMSWKNHGRSGKNRSWEIDHIIPLSYANNEVEAKKLTHYTNLRPLWSTHNREKSNSLDYVYPECYKKINNLLKDHGLQPSNNK